MSDQIPDYTPLSDEQLQALNDAQREIYLNLGEKDRRFFAQTFSPAGLGEALERKWEIIKSRSKVEAFDQKLKKNLAAAKAAPPPKHDLTAKDIAIGTAGVAGLVGMGVLARKIAPDGKAAWQGVTPRDLVNALAEAFGRQEGTDVRFQPPNEAGALQATILMRADGKLVPALNIFLTPAGEGTQVGTQVQISKVSPQSMIEAFKEGGGKLVDLVQEGVRAKKYGGIEDFLALAGSLVNKGGDLAKLFQDMDLEDRAWEVIQQAAEPLEKMYKEKMVSVNEARYKLETAWDDFYTCPKCRVEFGAQDTECRVCGTERPPMPEQADPRQVGG